MASFQSTLAITLVGTSWASKPKEVSGAKSSGYNWRSHEELNDHRWSYDSVLFMLMNMPLATQFAPKLNMLLNRFLLIINLVSHINLHGELFKLGSIVLKSMAWSAWAFEFTKI